MQNRTMLLLQTCLFAVIEEEQDADETGEIGE